MVFEKKPYVHLFIKSVFRALGLYQRGVRNALDIRLRNLTFEFSDLPDPFDGYRVMFVSDLHLDFLEGLTEKLKGMVGSHPVDLCILGGDYRTGPYASTEKAVAQTKELLKSIDARDGIYAVLGNHDCFEMISPLEESGVRFLVNRSVWIEKEGTRLWLSGMDDSLCSEGQGQMFSDLPDHGFSIFVAHGPGLYADAESFKPNLYLCGHTHAGQVQIPGIGPVITHCKASRKMVCGKWRFGGMQGYTSSGAGVSGVPVRFGCRGEVVVVCLKKKQALPNF